MPDGLTEIVGERSQIWLQYDAATQRIVELNTLAGRVRNTGTITPVAALTQEAVPTDEVARTVMELQTGLRSIEQAENQISARQEEIRRIRSRVQTIYAAMFILLFFAVAVAFSVLT